ncbi:MAG: hypothetical protein DRG87_09210 [Deltaproteobacteria bacterium]|nr:hypothetical protein [Deltaproteobacteria bacterium]RLB28493.1 MAG: hypothetical protein DRG87_09210 [Deltaproteobacteria bacterium]
MLGKEFINSVANGKMDIIQMLLDVLAETGSRYCLIGGLAVNAYVEPVVSLDLDIVAAIKHIEAICKAAERRGLRVERFEHSVNLTSEASDLRIQLQTDPRYQEFLSDAESHAILGYKMKVAKLGDVLRGKVWAYMDKERRKSKRQKDLADILRIIEAYPELEEGLPQSLRSEVRER